MLHFQRKTPYSADTICFWWNKSTISSDAQKIRSMIFVCDQCGICCKHIDQIPQLKQFDSGNGQCIHLTDNNLCAIYSDRPDICNVDKMFELQFEGQISKEEYIKLNIEGCNELKKNSAIFLPRNKP